VTPDELNHLFDSAHSNVFRLEKLQTYAVPADDASLVAFRRGTPRPERSVRTNAFLRRVAVRTLTAGVAWSRARLVEWPLTEYTRWELLGYVESQAAGEEIRLVDAGRVEDVVARAPDFWLFDAGTPDARAVLMHYTGDGRLVERELVADPAEVARLATIKDEVVRRAASLNEFLARPRAGADG
jgi:uncharacterized protein DUF6879